MYRAAGQVACVPLWGYLVCLQLKCGLIAQNPGPGPDRSSISQQPIVSDGVGD